MEVDPRGIEVARGRERPHQVCQGARWTEEGTAPERTKRQLPEGLPFEQSHRDLAPDENDEDGGQYKSAERNAPPEPCHGLDMEVAAHEGCPKRGAVVAVTVSRPTHRTFCGRFVVESCDRVTCCGDLRAGPAVRSPVARSPCLELVREASVPPFVSLIGPLVALLFFVSGAVDTPAWACLRGHHLCRRYRAGDVHGWTCVWKLSSETLRRSDSQPMLRRRVALLRGERMRAYEALRRSAVPLPLRAQVVQRAGLATPYRRHCASTSLIRSGHTRCGCTVTDDVVILGRASWGARGKRLGQR